MDRQQLAADVISDGHELNMALRRLGVIVRLHNSGSLNTIYADFCTTLLHYLATVDACVMALQQEME